jgi:hypothetical protein
MTPLTRELEVIIHFRATVGLVATVFITHTLLGLCGYFIVLSKYLFTDTTTDY